MSEKMKIPFGKQFVGKRKFTAALNVLKGGKYVHGPKSFELEVNKKVKGSCYY